MNSTQIQTELTQIRQMVSSVATMLRKGEQVTMPPQIYMRTYNFAFNVKDPQIVRSFLQSWLREYLNQEVVPNLLKGDFVQKLIQENEIYLTLTHWLRTLFKSYEDKMGKKDATVFELALNELDQVFQKDNLKSLFVDNYIAQLNEIRQANSGLGQLDKYQLPLLYFHRSQKERLTTDQDLELLKLEVVQVSNGVVLPNTLKNISQYDTYIREQIVTSTFEYYSKVASVWLQTGTSNEYVKNANKQIEHEIRISDSIYKWDKQGIFKAIYDALLSKNADLVINNPQGGLKNLFENQDLDRIEAMYNLYQIRDTDLEKMMRVFQDYIKLSIDLYFVDLVPNPAWNPAQLQHETMQSHKAQIEKVYNLYNYATRCLTEPFHSNHRFRNFLELGFKERINSHEKFVQKFCFYITFNLKDKLKETTSENDQLLFKQFLEVTMKVLEFINNKQSMFMNYRSSLKDRIFKGEIKNIGYEDEFIKDLKKRYPEHIPQDVVTIWDDYQKARASDQQVLEKLSKEFPGAKVQFTVLTKTNALFEFNQREIYTLPAYLNNLINIYDKFYKDKLKTEKQLIWNFKLGQGQIQYTTSAGSFKLLVSVIQLIILFYLKSGPQTIHELSGQSKIRIEDIQHHLKPLIDFGIVDNKQDILTASTNLQKLKIALKPGAIAPLVPKKSQDQQEEQKRYKEEMEFAQKERDIKIQSLTVRLMKSKKEMMYADLLQGVNQNLKFFYDFQPKDVLRQIDELITGNYMKRDEKINNKFIYTPAQ